MIECRACLGRGYVAATSELFPDVQGTRGCRACNGTGKLDGLEKTEVKQCYSVGPDPDETNILGYRALFQGPLRATREEAEADQGMLAPKKS